MSGALRCPNGDEVVVRCWMLRQEEGETDDADVGGNGDAGGFGEAAGPK